MTGAAFRDRLAAADRPLWGVWVNNPSPRSVGGFAETAFDWVCIDEQHGYAPDDLPSSVAAATDSGTPAFVRVAWNRPELIGRALDCGASGIIVPMVENATEAAAAARASRYPPRGARSFGPGRHTYGVHPLSTGPAADAMVCLVMVETADALANVDEIAATPGVDGIFVGPFDLSLALGLNVDEMLADHAESAPLPRILRACREHGILAAAYGGVPQRAAVLRDHGFRMVLVSTDDGVLAAGSAAVLAGL